MKAARPPALLVLAVLAAHLLLGREVQRLHEGWLSEGAPAMPARLQVALVREMTLAAPPTPALVRRLGAPRPPAPLVPAGVSALPPAPAGLASAPEPALPRPVAVAVAEPASAHAAASDAAGEAAGASPSVTSSEPAPEAEPGPEWPLSTRLSYGLTGHYRGPIHGQAQVEWLRRGRDYQVHLDVGLGPSFAPLLTRRLSSSGVLTPAGIAPQRYDEETRAIVGDARRAGLRFEPGAVQLTQGERVPVPPGAQDAASQFVQLTWLFLTGREPLQAGHAVRFPLVLPRRAHAAWQYDIVGEELLQTPLGPLAAWHLKPARPAGGGDLNAEVWLAPALQYLPVRLVIRQDADTYIDLMLRSAPLQAAPESATEPNRRLSQ